MFGGVYAQTADVGDNSKTHCNLNNIWSSGGSILAHCLLWTDLWGRMAVCGNFANISLVIVLSYRDLAEN